MTLTPPASLCRWIALTTTATDLTIWLARSPPQSLSFRKAATAHWWAHSERRVSRVVWSCVPVNSNCPSLCLPGTIWLHPPWETEEKEELQELWCCVREKLQGREHIRAATNHYFYCWLIYWLFVWFVTIVFFGFVTYFGLLFNLLKSLHLCYAVVLWQHMFFKSIYLSHSCYICHCKISLVY